MSESARFRYVDGPHRGHVVRVTPHGPPLSSASREVLAAQRRKLVEEWRAHLPDDDWLPSHEQMARAISEERAALVQRWLRRQREPGNDPS